MTSTVKVRHSPVDKHGLAQRWPVLQRRSQRDTVSQDIVLNITT